MSVGKTAGYNNKILISNIDRQVGSNRNINNQLYHKSSYHHKTRSPVTSSKTYAAYEKNLVKSPNDESIKDCLVAQHEHTVTILPVDSQKMVAGQHNDVKLAI